MLSSSVFHNFFSKKLSPVVIDVRSAEEYICGHIPNSILIPHTEIKEVIGDEVPDKDTPLKLYCRSGERSFYSKQILLSEGYKNVEDLGSIENAKKVLASLGKE